MIFTSAPRNDFPEFIETYFERCRARAPHIEAIAGKWTLEDLIPGLSDFDVRFIVRDSLNAQQWCEMAMEVAKVHLELACERKEWARTLEHLPGVNLSWSELFDPNNYYPEFAQWSFYHGPSEKLAAFEKMISTRPWDENETTYHWKKIAIYYGAYDREIDAPINLGAYENKYSLHSRLMHYLAPPVHSLVCLHDQRTGAGKIDAFRRAREIFPLSETMDEVLSLIERHYEAPEYLQEPGQTILDEKLETYLREATNRVLAQQSWLQCAPNASRDDLKKAIKTCTGEPGLSQLFELVKFARLMKGRLWYYAQNVSWFDSLPLIRNEMNRMRANFLEQPLQLFAKYHLKKSLNWDECLQELEGDLLTHEQVAACRNFAILADPAMPDAALKQRAIQIVEGYEPFLAAMENVVHRAACPDQLRLEPYK